MNIPFTKMHGLGNDFILVEEDQLPPDHDLSGFARAICDRHFGIGADGLIIVAPPDDPFSDIRMVIYNSDGSQPEMCGNGIRCFARYVKDQGIIKKSEFKVETLAGPMIPHINADLTVTVDMGQPVLEAEAVPFRFPEGLSPVEPAINIPVHVTPDLTVPISAISMGNPHGVIFRHEVPQAMDVQTLGPVIEKNPVFPAKANIEFVKVLDKHAVEVDVWERGAGITLACGTGACAVTVAGILRGFLESPVQVTLPGGDLSIEWNGQDGVMMSGPATYVFAGMYPLTNRTLSTHGA